MENNNIETQIKNLEVELNNFIKYRNILKLTSIGLIATSVLYDFRYISFLPANMLGLAYTSKVIKSNKEDIKFYNNEINSDHDNKLYKKMYKKR